MPVASEIGCVFGEHDKMADAGINAASTAGTCVDLAGLIRLDGLDHQRAERRILHVQLPQSAQRTTSNVITMKVTTMTTSVLVLFCWRNGLNPTTPQRSCSVLSSR